MDVLCLVPHSCLTLCNPMACTLPGPSVHGGSPGKNTGVGCHALLQRILPTQGWNPGFPHCRRILYHLSHQGSPNWCIGSVQFSHSVVSSSLWPHGRQHARPPCPSPPPLLKLMSIELVMPSNHLILCLPLLLPPSTFPRIRVFSNESFLRIRWPKYCSFSASASVLPSYGTGSHKISHWKWERSRQNSTLVGLEPTTFE